MISIPRIELKGKFMAENTSKINPKCKQINLRKLSKSRYKTGSNAYQHCISKEFIITY